MREAALEEARERERELRRGRWRGPLHGIPYGAKDLLATRNAPTTWGAAPYKDQRFDYDATVIRRLREAGAVLV
ncbi:amidase family protein, partial [Escherichia coli]|nr:amidase family protein [Escherichia coli]